MPDEPGSPEAEGITTVKQVEASAPAEPENAAEPSGGDADKSARFRNPDGTLDGEKAAKAWGELQTKLDAQGNEVGELRKAYADAEAFYESEYVNDPDNPGQAVHKSVLDNRQSQSDQPPSGGQLTKDEINEKLRDMIDLQPDEFLKLSVALASNELRAEQAVFTDPASQKIVGDYPDVEPRARDLARQLKIPLKQAFTQALGEKMLAAAAGGDATSSPKVDLRQLTNAGRTYLGPEGTTLESKEKSTLTSQEIEAGKKLGYTAEQLEPFSNKNWENH